MGGGFFFGGSLGLRGETDKSSVVAVAEYRKGGNIEK